ncbi:MAG: hypothetical protein A2X67_12550 [Ignavibacteria bacterium GWA2_55_11]|nr:MAG: hypothetical protein A2X67_12550 [Ignavibacteria bacterium GWA2_55_11]
MNFTPRISARVAVLAICAAFSGLDTHALSQDKSFILIGDVHFDKLTLHDMSWLQTNYPNDVAQVNNYSQITQNNFSAFISELLHQSQIVTPVVAGMLQMGDLQEGLAGNITLATQMAQEARDSLRAPSFIPPWILVKGNHEVTGPGGAEAFNSIILPFVASELNQSIPGTSYATRIGDVQIIVIDCYDRTNVIPFLRSQLTGSDARFKIVATHMPVIPVTARLWHIFQDDAANRDTLLNLLAMHKALVVCGHLHKYSVVSRATPYGPVVQVMAASVISDRNRHTPSYYVTSFGPSLVDLEPGYDNKSYLTIEARSIRSYRMAEMPGYAVLKLNGTTGARRLDVFAGLGEFLYETVDLSTFGMHADTSGMGEIVMSPNDSVFLAETKVAVRAVPALGWKFDGWSGSLSGTLNPDTVVMNGEKNISAAFSQIPAGQYEIRTTIEGSGVVVASPAGPYYSPGTVVTLTACSDAGSTFSGWGGQASGSDTSITVTVDSHLQVTAKFRALGVFSINAISGPHGTVIFDPSASTYLEGTKVQLNAIPEYGWEFAEWLGDVNGTTYAALVTVTANMGVRAVFRKVGGGVVVLRPTDDSYIRGSFGASRNFNADSALRVREGISDLNRFRTYLRFDLQSISGNVLGAFLKMRVQDSGLTDGEGVGAGVYGVSTDSWTETTLKWNGAPVAGSLIDTTTANVEGNYYGWDVGTYVTAEIAGDRTVSVMVKDFKSLDRRIEFGRREDGKGSEIVVLTDTPTDVEPELPVPAKVALYQNYPNPFNPRTTIHYDLVSASDVSIHIYDMLGREVKRLIDEQQGPGSLSVAWDGRDDAEQPVGSGIYLLRFRAGSHVENSKLMLIK